VNAGTGHRSIGEVLGELQDDFPDVTISKIRFLEAEGLVEPARTASGYRKFGPADIERLRYVLSCQRDHYLPLKVIREHLDAIDRGLDPPSTGSGEGPRVPRNLMSAAALPGADAFNARSDVRLSRGELLAETDMEAKLLDQLESFGIIVPIPPAGANRHYDSVALEIARIVSDMAVFGIEPRHLRPFKVAADREVGLVEQVVTPLARQRDPDSAQRADEAIRELSALSVRLHVCLVRNGLGRELRR
jgi:DNA-binding transcriptional MerR regulator